ncbi:MAG: hypothetical protein ACI4ET_07260 [Bilifractor sp.]
MSDDINVVSLSKGVYDSMRETNSRAKLLLDEMMDIRNVKLSEDENSIEFSQRAINDAVRVLFNDTYNRKLGALKMKRTKEMLGK